MDQLTLNYETPDSTLWVGRVKMRMMIRICVIVMLLSTGHAQHAEQTGALVDQLRKAVSKINQLAGSAVTTPDLKLALLRTDQELLMTVADAVVNYNVTEMCMNHTLQLLNDTIAGRMYALRMIDALGKPPAGMLDLNIKWLGSYEECLTVNESDRSPDFNPNYCMVTGKPLALPIPLPIQLRVGMCVPDSCDRHDVIGLSNAVLSVVSPQTSGVASSSCTTDEQPWTAGDFIAIFFCAVFGLLTVVGSGYDLYRRRRQSSTTFNVNITTDVGDVIGDGADADRTSDGDQLIQFTKKPDQGQALSRRWQLLMAFSLMKNGDKLFDISNTQKEIQILHGIRALSMWWVILGHTHSFYAMGYVDNLGQALPILQRWTFQAISNATFSVDSFFFLSGLLVCYLTLNYLRANDGAIKWRWFYIHRYLRLTPVYAFFMMIFSTLYFHLPRTPQGNYQLEQTGLDDCKKYWWTNLLYINNFYPIAFGSECMGWVWYLANDMQFYVISPLFIIALYKRPRLGLALISVAVLLSLGITGFITNYFHAYGVTGGVPGLIVPKPAHPYPNATGFDYVYGKPYCRISVYLVGMVTGFILHLTSCQPARLPIKTMYVVLGWCAAWAVALAVIYGFSYDIKHGVQLSAHTLSFYFTVSRFCWAISLAWLVIACVHGYGGFITTILEWKFWIPISRLTYCAYLVHPAWIFFHAFTLRATIHYDDMTMVYYFLGSLCISYALAVVLTLLVEAPLMTVEKVLVKNR